MTKTQVPERRRWGDTHKPEILALVEYLPKWRIRATILIHLPHGKAYRVYESRETTDLSLVFAWLHSLGADIPRIVIVHPGAQPRREMPKEG